MLLTALLVLWSCGDDGALPAVTDSDATTSSPSPTTPTTPPGTASPGATGSSAPEPPVERLRVEVIERRAHDASSFTQGLELHDGVLYESAGLYGESSVRAVDPDTGDVNHRRDLDDSFFGEGLTVIDDELVVLTWQEHTAIVLETGSLDERRRHEYESEGWGICDDGDRLVMSDGTDVLRFRDRDSFAEIGRVDVTLDGAPVTMLNELECVDAPTGAVVYANVWKTDTIVRIDPATGRVTAEIDASGLLDAHERTDRDAVLNGIAYDATAGTFLVTGKLWPALFEVRFVPLA